MESFLQKSPGGTTDSSPGIHSGVPGNAGDLSRIPLIRILLSVIPVKAGIQFFQYLLDPGFRRGDDGDWLAFS